MLLNHVTYSITYVKKNYLTIFKLFLQRILYKSFLFFKACYFPMQNFPKIFPKISSLLICPVISPRWYMHSRMS